MVLLSIYVRLWMRGPAHVALREDLDTPTNQRACQHSVLNFPLCLDVGLKDQESAPRWRIELVASVRFPQFAERVDAKHVVIGQYEFWNCHNLPIPAPMLEQ